MYTSLKKYKKRQENNISAPDVDIDFERAIKFSHKAPVNFCGKEGVLPPRVEIKNSKTLKLIFIITA